MAQIGTVRIQTGSGTKTLPVFDTADAGSNVYDLIRVQTPSGVGFIPFVSTNDAQYPEVRVQTQNQGVLAAHNDSSLVWPSSISWSMWDDMESYDLPGWTSGISRSGDSYEGSYSGNVSGSGNPYRFESGASYDAIRFACKVDSLNSNAGSGSNIRVIYADSDWKSHFSVRYRAGSDDHVEIYHGDSDVIYNGINYGSWDYWKFIRRNDGGKVKAYLDGNLVLEFNPSSSEPFRGVSTYNYENDDLYIDSIEMGTA